jgi:hypothetical protein
MLLCMQDQNGTIDFREYVIGLSLLSHPASEDATLELAFKVRMELFFFFGLDFAYRKSRV